MHHHPQQYNYQYAPSNSPLEPGAGGSSLQPTQQTPSNTLGHHGLLQNEGKSISWCKKRTIYHQNGSRGVSAYGGGTGSVGVGQVGGGGDFTSPSSYFEGEDEEDLNTVLQSYLESTASFSDGQSSSSPSQQSTDSGFAGDAGYATPSSSSYYSNPSHLGQTNPTTTGYENNNSGYYNNNSNQQQQQQQQQTQQQHGYYQDYNSLSGGQQQQQVQPFLDYGGYAEPQQQHYVHPSSLPSSGVPEEDFTNSSEDDLSVIVDQVLSSMDDVVPFDTSEDLSALLPPDNGATHLLSPCDQCGRSPHLNNNNKECKNCCEEVNNGETLHSGGGEVTTSTPNPSIVSYSPEASTQKAVVVTEVSTSHSSFGSNVRKPSPSSPCSTSSPSGTSPKSVAAVQPMQRSVGVVEPRVVVKIPLNKFREAGDLGEGEVLPVINMDLQKTDDLSKKDCVEQEEVHEKDYKSSEILPPALSPINNEFEEPVIDKKMEEEEEEESITPVSMMETSSSSPPPELVVAAAAETVPTPSRGKSSSHTSHHHHHKKKKHKRKKKKLCKCGGSKKRKRCETPVSTPGLEPGRQVNPLKIVRISESEEFKIQQQIPVLERQVYHPGDASFGGNKSGSLLSFRDLAMKAAAAEDNVMYSNDEDEDGLLTEENVPPPPLTPPPPTLHRHDSPEPLCDNNNSLDVPLLLQGEEEEDEFSSREESKEELADLLGDLPSVLPPPTIILSTPELKSETMTAPTPPPTSVVKVEAPLPAPPPVQVIKKEALLEEKSPKSTPKTKMLLEKDPEDEWLYCQTKHCHFWTRKPSRMERHKKTHAGTEEDSYYVCPDCFAKFYSLAKMLKHDRKFHTGEKDYECKICEAEVTDIHVHMRVHRADKEFRCSTCPLTFRHKNSLVRHVFQHSGERPYKCQTCNSGFFSLSKLKEHVRRRHTVAQVEQQQQQQQPTPIQMPIKAEGLLRQYPKLAPRISSSSNPGDDDVVIVGLKPAPANSRALSHIPSGNTPRTILAPSSIILPPQPAPQAALSYLAQGPNGSVYLVTNPAPGANIFLGQGGEGILMQPQQPLFIPQSPVLIPQQSQAPPTAAPLLQPNSNSTLFVVPAGPVLNVPTTAQQPQHPAPHSSAQQQQQQHHHHQQKPPEKKLDILQQAILEIPDHFQSFEEE